ncbi:hypothetical protein AOQ73_36480 [Bradyrhizobium pachyrhizi]|uniref:hypothetical protein n=1 Tax=Bradyrhizobium pachyrhizi TaxID=280333 RepID=UPI0007052143|nr:hypothetical protein [Bradyrhizobium pachyrhizi]KRP85974.1 hypothetical protein AOQ73_36480 [Bradyrhizobium pachyrhizi]
MVSIEPQDGEIEFHFEKSNYFRVIHVDGAAGSLAPGGNYVHMAVYSERAPIPKKAVFNSHQGQLGDEVAEKREARSGVFRELEADLVMSLDAAIALRDWLAERILEGQAVAELMRSRRK